MTQCPRSLSRSRWPRRRSTCRYPFCKVLLRSEWRPSGAAGVRAGLPWGGCGMGVEWVGLGAGLVSLLQTLSRVCVCVSLCESWGARVECLWSSKTLGTDKGKATKLSSPLGLLKVENRTNPSQTRPDHIHKYYSLVHPYIYRGRPRRAAARRSRYNPCHGRPCRAAAPCLSRRGPCITHAEGEGIILATLGGGQRWQQWRVFGDGHRLVGRRRGEGGRELSDR